MLMNSTRPIQHTRCRSDNWTCDVGYRQTNSFAFFRLSKKLKTDFCCVFLFRSFREMIYTGNITGWQPFPLKFKFGYQSAHACVLQTDDSQSVATWTRIGRTKKRRGRRWRRAVGRMCVTLAWFPASRKRSGGVLLLIRRHCMFNLGSKQ